MSKAAMSRAFVIVALTASLMACGLSPARADVFTNVPEASGYRLVYSLPIPNYPDFDATIPYAVNNAASIATGSFSRIGYYLEVDDGTGLKWVYASFDAAPFSTNASLLGVPTPANGEFYHYDTAGLLPGQVRNMNVASNVAGIVTGTGITTGNVEFWPSNYAQANQFGVPGASGTTFDFGDGGDPSTASGHGTMQIHNYGAAQTLMSLDHFNGGGTNQAGVGIGNQAVWANNDPDWTFRYNSAGYTVKNLQIVVSSLSSSTWNGTAGSDWGTAGNWTPNGVPDAAGSLATFGLQTGSNVVNLLSAGRTVGMMNFVAAAGTTIQSTGGYTLTLDNAGLPAAITVAGTHSITAPITLNSDLTVQGTGTLNLSGSIAAAGRGVTIGGASTVNLMGGGSLNNPTSLITQAGGTLTIANATVSMGSNANGVFGVGYGAAGTGTVTVNSGGVLNIGTGGGRTFIGGGPSGGTMGTGILNINAGGTVNVAAPGAFPNEAFYLGGYGGAGTINLNGGTLATARGISTGAGAAITLQAGGGTIDDLGNSITINSAVPIGGSGVLNKAGIGTLTLGSSTGMVNTFGGTLNINAGTLKIAGGNDNNNHFTGNPNIVVNSGGTLAFNAFNTFGLNTASMSAVTVKSGGTVLSSGDGANHVTVFNNLTLNGGTMTVNCNDGFGGSWGTFGFGGTTTATGNSTISLAGGYTGTIQNGNGGAGFGTFTVNTPATADSLTIAPALASGLALVKNGSGTLMLTGANNNYSGATTVNGGTLALAPTSGNTLGPVTIAGGAAGARLLVQGTTNLGGNTMTVANAAADRSTVVFSANATMNRLYPGNVGAGAVIQNSGAVSVATTTGSTDVLSLGLNGGYGYYQMNGGTLTAGQLAAGSGQGANDIGVFDQTGGTVNVTGGGGWLLAGGWTTNSKGSFNLYGGTMTGPSANPVTLNVFGNSSYGMLNLLGSSAVLDATANANGLDVMRATAAGSVVNLNAGRMIVSKVIQGGSGPAQFNFNGGTLQAGAANVTMALNTGGSAYIYSGGANIDTPGSNAMTISQPLLAPTGYGATNVAVTNGGAGYLGAPFVLLSGGSGVGATAIAQVDQATGKLTSILVTSPGSGYGAGDVLTATLYGGGATTAATVGAVTLGANTGGGLTKTGPGTLNLTGRNTFTGPLTVNAGTVSLPGGDNTSWLTGNPNVIVNSGGTLAFSNYNSFGNTLSSMSAVTVNAGGTVLSSGKVVVFNNMTLNGGTVTINGNDNYGATWGSFGFGGTTTATGNSVINNTAGSTGTIANANNLTPVFTVNTPAVADKLTISAPVGPSGGNPLSLVKQGAGTLALTGNNLYTGGTTVNQGTLEVSNPSLTPVNPLGTGAVTLAGGTLRLAGQAALSAAQQKISVTGWNQDIIIGASESAPGYTASMAGWNFYETGLSGGTQGLPADSGPAPRTFTSATNSNLSFQFAPYAGNNAVYLDGPASATLTLTTPGQYQSLAFLETTRSMSWYARLNFADGSTTTTSTWSDPDWTSNPGVADPALTSYGLKNTNGSFYSNYLWMAGRQIVLSAADQAKTLNSITFNTTSAGGNQLALFAVSGAPGVSGYGPAQTYGNAVTVTADSTIDVRNSLAATMGPLSIAGRTLSITGDSGAGVTFGSTTLTGNATFNTAANTALKLGPVGDGGAGYGVTKSGAGAMTLNGHSTYGGATVISGGTLRLSGAAPNLGNIMPTGDSITDGTSYNSTHAGYRGYLYDLLNAGGYTYTFVGSLTINQDDLPASQSHHEGHSGWNISQITGGITGSNWLNVNPDIIPLMIGTNNRGSVANVPGAMTDYSQLIDAISSRKPGALIMAAEIIPIPGQDDFVTAFNSALTSLVNAKKAAGANITLVNLYTGFPTPYGTTMPDNLHPSDIGYAWMAQQWYNAIVANLGIAGDNGLPAGTALSIGSTGTLDLNGVNQTIASLADQGAGGGRIINGGQAPVALTLNPAGGSTAFSGSIDGAISLVKNGAGTQVLSGASTYVGGTTINAGKLLVSNLSGSGTGSGAVLVNAGATLGGTGFITGSVTALAGGHVAPGNSPGTLHTGNLDLQAGSFFDVEMTPTVWDMLDVTGTVSVGGAILNLSPLSSFSSYEGGQYMIVQNDGSDAVRGIFAGLGEGASIEAGGAQFAITYTGGTGNDIVLTSVPEPASALLLLTALPAIAARLRRRVRRAA